MEYVNYQAFGIYSDALYIEIYSKLINANLFKDSPNRVNNDLLNKFSKKNKKTFNATVEWFNVKVGDSVTEHLIIYVRNQIHHPSEKARSASEEEKIIGLKLMLKILERGSI